MEEEKNNKQKVTEKETMIVDEQKRIIDIETILSEKKDNPIVNNVNNLMRCGSEYARMDILKETFERKAGTVVNEENALEVLREVFDELVNAVNNHDEFVAVDPKTGTKDIIRSEEKARENFDHAPTSRSRIDEILDKTIEKVQAEKDKPKHVEVNTYINENNLRKKTDAIDKAMKKLYEDNSEEFKEENEKVNNTNVTSEGVGKKLFEIYNQAKEEIAKYDEKEMKLFEFQRQLDSVKGTPKFDDINDEFNDFKKKNPELVSKYIGENGEIKQEFREESFKNLDAYNENLVKAGVIKQLQYLNGKSNLKPQQVKNIVSNLLIGLRFDETREEVAKQLEELIPGYKYSEDINNPKNREAIENILEIDTKLFDEGYQILLDISFKRMLESANRTKILEDNEKITDEELENFMNEVSQDIDVEEEVLNYKESLEERYFRNSKIKFSTSGKDDKKIESDADKFRYLYKKTSVLSWLDNKKAALIRRYVCLQYTRQELEKSDLPHKIIEEKLKQVNKEIEKFEKNNPKFDFKTYVDPSGNLRDAKARTAIIFSEFRGISKLTREFIKDEETINSLDDYSKLSDSEKELYLKNTILALNQKDLPGRVKSQDIKSILEKFGQRRLEIISNEAQPLLTDENGIQVNEEVLLKAYNQVSPIKFKTYKELVEYCGITRLEYTNEKLKLCEELDESSFQSIRTGSLDEDILIKKIEEYKITNWNKAKFFSNITETIRGESNAEDVDKLELDSNLKARITELDGKIGQEDVIMMEFLRLQGQIERSSGTEKKNILIERDSFIKQHPESAKNFLAYLNADNKDKIDINFELHNNSIVEKNTLLAIGTINALSDESLKDLVNNEDLRRQYLLTLVAALDGMVEDRHNELFHAIEKICPNTNFRTEDGKFNVDVEQISQLLGNELGIEECDTGKLMSLMYASKAVIVKNENVRRMKNANEIDFEDINIALNDKAVSQIFEYSQETDLSKNVRRDKEEIYFKNSKMTYTPEDAENFEQMYFEALSVSWIEKKEEVDKLYYTSLLLRKECLENNNSEGRKPDILEKKITEFEKSHPNINKEDFLENGNLKQKYRKDYQRYAEMKYTGDLISDYVLDENKVENPKDYEKMSDSEKKEYLQKTLFGVMEENNDIVYKLAKRRLEVIAKPNRKLVRQTGNDIEIDDNAFYKELDKYFNLSARNINDLEEFKNIFSGRKNAFINTRLKEYSELSEDKFTELGEKNHMSRAIKIEHMRERNKLKRSLETIILTKDPKSRGNIKKILEVTSEKTIIFGQEITQNNRDSGPRNESIPRGIEISEIKVADNYEKDIEHTTETIEESANNNSNNEKTSLLDKVKGLISTITKSQSENSEVVDKDGVSNEEGNLLPVETNKSLLSNIANRIKSLFYKEEKAPNPKEALPKENQLEAQDDFNKRIQCDGNIDNALRITQENADKKNKANGLEEGITQSDYDEDRVGV